MALNKDWQDLPAALRPEAEETLAEHYARIDAYAAANLGVLTPLDAVALEDLEARAQAELDAKAAKSSPVPWDVKNYDAIGDGITDDTAAIQATIDAHQKAVFNGGTYYAPNGVLLPNTNPLQRAAECSLIGYGATLKTDSTSAIIGRALPTDATNAGQMARWRFHIEGLRFEGNNTAGQKGISLAASYGSVIRRCHFQNFDVGCELIFAMMARVESCFGFENTTHAFVAKSGTGLWTGATAANSPSNHTVFKSCRDYCRTGQTASYYTKGSSGVVIEDCISEGFNPLHAIYFEHESNGRTFDIRNFHSENTPTISLVHAPAFNRVVVDGLRVGAATGVVIDANGSTAGSIIHVRNMPFFPTATAKFRHSTVGIYEQLWVFENIGTAPTLNLATATYWDVTAGGFVPEMVRHHRGGTGAEMGAAYPVIEAKRFGIVSPDIRLLASTGIRLGSVASAPIKGHLSGIVTWDPLSIADGAFTSTTVTVTGAAIGDTVAVGFTQAVPAGALLVGAVTAADTVTVTLFNKTGVALDLVSGSLRADAWKH